MRDLKNSAHFKHRLVLAVGVTALCILLILRCRYQLAVVVGASMRPTLNPGSLVIVDNRAYRTKEPTRGDVVLAHYRKELVIKRIVGLPGEEVELKHGVLYIDGRSEPENHPVEPGLLSIEKGTLLGGHFATLGDNRNVSDAQAVHPIVVKDDIMGRVVFSFANSCGQACPRAGY